MPICPLEMQKRERKARFSKLLRVQLWDLISCSSRRTRRNYRVSNSQEPSIDAVSLKPASFFMKLKIDRCPNPMGIRVWKIELRELENYGTFALRRAKKVH